MPAAGELQERNASAPLCQARSQIYSTAGCRQDGLDAVVTHQSADAGEADGKLLSQHVPQL